MNRAYNITNDYKSEFKHPFRDYSIRCYRSIDDEEPKFLAFIGPKDKVPAYFSGETQNMATIKAEEFRVNTIRDHEKDYIDRKEMNKRIQKTKERKKMEKGKNEN